MRSAQVTLTSTDGVDLIPQFHVQHCSGEAVVRYAHRRDRPQVSIDAGASLRLDAD